MLYVNTEQPRPRILLGEVGNTIPAAMHRCVPVPTEIIYQEFCVRHRMVAAYLGGEYVGKAVRAAKDGQGRLVYENEDIYEEKFADDLRHGEGE